MLGNATLFTLKGKGLWGSHNRTLRFAGWFFLMYLPIASAQSNFALAIDPQPTLGIATASLAASTVTDVTCGFQNPTGSVHTGSTPTDCTHSYAQNSQVILTATANPLYQFVAWQGGCDGATTSITITMDQAKTCNPFFIRNASNAYTQISAGDEHRCAVQRSGGIQCWGVQRDGRLGNGDSADIEVTAPANVQNISTAIAVSAGENHSCAVLASGTAQCWGHNASGQLGIGNTTDYNTPQDVMGLTTAIAISAGSNYTCAIIANGSVWCWGKNGNGALGLGDTNETMSPTKVNDIDNAIDIAASGNHTCAVLSNGEAGCWGANGSGQLGTGDNDAASTPSKVSNLSTAIAIAVRGIHTCAVLANGKVRCWGWGNTGRLGTGNNNSANTPQEALVISTAIDTALGEQNSCALLANGEIYCWGRDDNGQLGSSASSQNGPVKVDNISTAISVAASQGDHTCAVLANGTAQCWGKDIAAVPTAVPSNPLLLTPDSITLTAYYGYELLLIPNLQGIATEWAISGVLPGWLTFTTSVGILSGTPMVSDSDATNLVITARNTAVNPAQQVSMTITAINLISPPTSITIEGTANPNAISEHTLPGITITDIALVANNHNDMTVPVTWSLLTTGSPFTINSNNAAITLAQTLDFETIDSYTLTVQAHFPIPEQAMAQPTLTPITVQATITINIANMPDLRLTISPQPTNGVVTASPTASPAMTDINCGFQNLTGSVHTGSAPTDCTQAYTEVTQVTLTATANYSYQFLAWQGDCNGTTANITITIDRIRTCRALFTRNSSNLFTRIGTGGGHQCAIQRNGSIQCWGFGGTSRFGNGTNASSGIPIDGAIGVSTAIDISVSGRHACIVLADGGARCWGWGGEGQLGRGVRGSSSFPAVVVGLSNVASIIATSLRSCAVLANGRVYCWGASSQGALGVGSSNTTVQHSSPVLVPGITTAIDVDGGLNHTCAVLANRTAQCWGDNSSGQLGNGGATGTTSTPVTVSNLSNAVDIATGDNHTCTILLNKTIQCWGSGGQGRLGNGATEDSNIPVDVMTINDAIAISAGAGSSCALQEDSSIQCWGANADGQLGIGNKVSSSIPQQVHNISAVIDMNLAAQRACAILSNGAVYCWGKNTGTIATVQTRQALEFKASSATVSALRNQSFTYTPSYRGIATHWSHSGSLPPWLSLSASTGVFYGIPQASDSTITNIMLIAQNTDQPQTATFVLNINIEDSPESFIIRDTNSDENNISESASPNTVVSGITLVAIRSRDDSQPSVIWSLAEQNTLFTINENSGIIISNASLDYEMDAQHILTVIAQSQTNSDLLAELAITINVANVLETLVIADTNDAANTISEAASANDPVDGLSLTSPNDLSTSRASTWSLMPTDSPFSIGNNTGVITLTGALDYETVHQYILTVIAQDQENSSLKAEQVITISIVNALESLIVMDTNDAANTISEAASANDPVDGLSLTSPNDLSTSRASTWSLMPTDSPFSIGNNTGVVTLTGALDYETVHQYTLTVIAQDQENSILKAEQVITISIVNALELLIVIDTNDAANILSEAVTINTIVGSVTLIAQDEGDNTRTVSWSLLTTAVPFDINSGNGDITLTGSLDYETNPSYTITILATDSVNTAISGQTDVIIRVTNALEILTASNTGDPMPTLISANNGTQVPGIELKVVDENDTTATNVTWSLTSTSTTFEIDSASGQVTVLDANGLASGMPITIALRATKDGIESNPVEIIINVINTLRLHLKLFLEGPLQ